MSTRPQRLVSRPVLYSAIAIGAFVALLYLLRGVLAPVLFAFIVAYMFSPLVAFLSEKKVPRAISSGLCLLIMIFIGTGLTALIVPAMQQELRGVAHRMPNYLDKIQTHVIPWVEETLGIEVPQTLSETLSAAKGDVGKRVGQLAGPVTHVLRKVLSGTLSLLASLIYFILVPLFIFTFLKDYEKIMEWFKGLLPMSIKTRAVSMMIEIDEVLAGFLRGQIIVVTTLAVIYSVALSLMGVPAAITIGIIAGLFNVVPYLGTITGLALSFVFLLLEGAPWAEYFMVSALFVGVSTMDGLFFTPRVLGKKMGLSPVIVILGILAFGEVFGFVGVLMAVPVTAISKVIARHALDAYRKSKFYLGDDPKDPCGPGELETGE